MINVLLTIIIFIFLLLFSFIIITWVNIKRINNIIKSNEFTAKQRIIELKQVLNTQFKKNNLIDRDMIITLVSRINELENVVLYNYNKSTLHN